MNNIEAHEKFMEETGIKVGLMEFYHQIQKGITVEIDRIDKSREYIHSNIVSVLTKRMIDAALNKYPIIKLELSYKGRREACKKLSPAILWAYAIGQENK